ncbi:hypothetical protein [Nocardia abscessus]|uniref:hypothetical protein n=1 Tax=Nocardia abscessus TaxID=120957 RepID=UPI0024573C97|nr:hypothetical protein [Nocardia abscessus]
MSAKAIESLREDLTDDPRHDPTTVREMAEQVGYRLIEMLTPSDEIEPDPATWLLSRVHEHCTAAMVIADHRHIREPMMDAITAEYGVVTPYRSSPAASGIRRGER